MKQKAHEHDCSGWLLPMMTLGLIAGILIGRAATCWQLPAAGFAVSALLFMPQRGRGRSAALVLLAACLGCILYVRADHPAIPEEGTYTAAGFVTQEVSLREDGQVQTRLTAVSLNGQCIPGDAYWTYYLRDGETLPDALRPGAYVRMTARVYHPSGVDSPGGFDFRAYLLQRGMTCGLYGADDMAFPAEDAPFALMGKLAALRHRISVRLMELMGLENGAYAAAMLLGERLFLPEEDVAAFRDLGIAHILSVSGYHVAVLVMMLGTLLRPLHLSRRARLMVMMAALGCYAILVGGDAPIIRAVLFCLLLEVGRILHVQRPPLHILCAAMAFQLALSPLQLFSASFQLTYGAMAGLMLVQPVLVRWFDARRGLRWLAEPLASALAAQIGILPAQLYWFGEFPLLALPANMLLLWAVNGVAGLYWVVLAALPVPGLCDGLGQLAALVTNGFLRVVRAMQNLGCASLWTKQANALTFAGWVLVLLALSVLLPKNRRGTRRILALTGAAVMLISLIPLPHHGTEYLQFSVGEADAALLHDADTVVVIDTGEEGHVLADYLHERRLSVDVLILTHLHTDHVGGLRALLDRGIPIRRCFLPVGATAACDVDAAAVLMLEELADAGTVIRGMESGHVLHLPGGTLTCLWPDPQVKLTGETANDGSLTLLAELHGTRMLLTGDLTAAYEMYAAASADILKAAHHGSSGSTSAGFLDTVAPQLILLSCGNDERRADLAERTGDIPLLDTNESGTITLTFTDGSFTACPYLP